MWALWVLGGLVLWAVVALAVGLVIGRGIRLADQREALSPVDRPVAVPAARRRAVPLPPVGVALAAVAVLLEGSGFVLRLRHATGPVMRVLSMDAPLSLPRLYVAGLFALAAAAALIGAGNLPGRRAWWTAVGVVTGLVSAVKAGGTVHAVALSALIRAVGATAAQVISVLLAGAVLAVLWWLSRTERRDRRRVLGTLALYAVAAVGLSAVSEYASGWTISAAATFVEEAGEALSAVAVLVAVLVGVAPRLVLPADWRLRREADAHTLDVAQALPGAVPGSWSAGR